MRQLMQVSATSSSPNCAVRNKTKSTEEAWSSWRNSQSEELCSVNFPHKFVAPSRLSSNQISFLWANTRSWSCRAHGVQSLFQNIRALWLDYKLFITGWLISSMPSLFFLQQRRQRLALQEVHSQITCSGTFLKQITLFVCRLKFNSASQQERMIQFAHKTFQAGFPFPDREHCKHDLIRRQCLSATLNLARCGRVMLQFLTDGSPWGVFSLVGSQDTSIDKERIENQNVKALRRTSRPQSEDRTRTTCLERESDGAAVLQLWDCFQPEDQIGRCGQYKVQVWTLCLETRLYQYTMKATNVLASVDGNVGNGNILTMLAHSTR